MPTLQALPDNNVAVHVTPSQRAGCIDIALTCLECEETDLHEALELHAQTVGALVCRMLRDPASYLSCSCYRPEEDEMDTVELEPASEDE